MSGKVIALRERSPDRPPDNPMFKWTDKPLTPQQEAEMRAVRAFVAIGTCPDLKAMPEGELNSLLIDMGCPPEKLSKARRKSKRR